MTIFGDYWAQILGNPREPLKNYLAQHPKVY
jgi:hypothetical protein